jgi:hypothetical protein
VPLDVKDYKSDLQNEMEELRGTHGRIGGINAYGEMYSYSEEVFTWDSEENNYVGDEVQVKMPLPAMKIECWILQGLTDVSDPDRYVYDRFGRKRFFVKRPL